MAEGQPVDWPHTTDSSLIAASEKEWRRHMEFTLMQLAAEQCQHMNQVKESISELRQLLCQPAHAAASMHTMSQHAHSYQAEHFNGWVGLTSAAQGSPLFQPGPVAEGTEYTYKQNGVTFVNQEPATSGPDEVHERRINMHDPSDAPLPSPPQLKRGSLSRMSMDDRTQMIQNMLHRPKVSIKSVMQHMRSSRNFRDLSVNVDSPGMEHSGSAPADLEHAVGGDPAPSPRSRLAAAAGTLGSVPTVYEESGELLDRASSSATDRNSRPSSTSVLTAARQQQQHQQRRGSEAGQVPPSSTTTSVAGAGAAAAAVSQLGAGYGPGYARDASLYHWMDDGSLRETPQLPQQQPWEQAQMGQGATGASPSPPPGGGDIHYEQSPVPPPQHLRPITSMQSVPSYEKSLLNAPSSLLRTPTTPPGPADISPTRAKSSLPENTPKVVKPTSLAFEWKGRRYDVGVDLRYLLWDVWDPSDAPRANWDMLMLLLLVYVVVVTPFNVGFNVDTSDLKSAIAIIDLLVNALFMLDVLCNFRTAIPGDDGFLVRDRRIIARNYFFGWFWLDLLSSLPYDNIVGNGHFGLIKILRTTRIFRFIKVFRMLQMLRLLRLRSFIHILEEVVGRAMFRMGFFVLTTLALLHWAACAFHFTALMYPPDALTWLTYPEGPGRPYDDAPVAERYIAALYWSVTTMATVGYGDIIAVTNAEKIVAMVVMLAGASVFGYFMGSMATLIAAMNSTEARMARKKAAVDDFVRHRKIPKRLSDKIRNYYNYTLNREVHTDEADIIAGLSTSLRMQVVLHLYREALEKVPFFRGKHPQFITSLVTYLKLEYYSPGDVVVRQGDVGNEMYFIGEGKVEVRVYDEGTDYSTTVPESVNRPSKPGTKSPNRARSQWLAKLRERRRKKREAEMMMLNEDLINLPYRLVGTLEAGHYFGEYSCMLGEPRAATVVATSYCELYSLSRVDLEAVVQRWPELAEELSMLVQDSTIEFNALEVREQMGLSLARYSINPVHQHGGNGGHGNGPGKGPGPGSSMFGGGSSNEDKNLNGGNNITHGRWTRSQSAPLGADSRGQSASGAPPDKADEVRRTPPPGAGGPAAAVVLPPPPPAQAPGDRPTPSLTGITPAAARAAAAAAAVAAAAGVHEDDELRPLGLASARSSAHAHETLFVRPEGRTSNSSANEEGSRRGYSNMWGAHITPDHSPAHSRTLAMRLMGPRPNSDGADGSSSVHGGGAYDGFARMSAGVGTLGLSRLGSTSDMGYSLDDFSWAGSPHNPQQQGQPQQPPQLAAEGSNPSLPGPPLGSLMRTDSGRGGGGSGPAGGGTPELLHSSSGRALLRGTLGAPSATTSGGVGPHPGVPAFRRSLSGHSVSSAGSSAMLPRPSFLLAGARGSRMVGMEQEGVPGEPSPAQGGATRRVPASSEVLSGEAKLLAARVSGTYKNPISKDLAVAAGIMLRKSIGVSSSGAVVGDGAASATSSPTFAHERSSASGGIMLLSPAATASRDGADTASHQPVWFMRNRQQLASTPGFDSPSAAAVAATLAASVSTPGIAASRPGSDGAVIAGRGAAHASLRLVLPGSAPVGGAGGSGSAESSGAVPPHLLQAAYASTAASTGTSLRLQRPTASTSRRTCSLDDIQQHSPSSAVGLPRRTFVPQQAVLLENSLPPSPSPSPSEPQGPPQPPPWEAPPPMAPAAAPAPRALRRAPSYQTLSHHRASSSNQSAASAVNGQADSPMRASPSLGATASSSSPSEGAVGAYAPANEGQQQQQQQQPTSPPLQPVLPQPHSRRTSRHHDERSLAGAFASGAGLPSGGTAARHPMGGGAARTRRLSHMLVGQAAANVVSNAFLQQSTLQQQVHTWSESIPGRTISHSSSHGHGHGYSLVARSASVTVGSAGRSPLSRGASMSNLNRPLDGSQSVEAAARPGSWNVSSTTTGKPGV